MSFIDAIRARGLPDPGRRLTKPRLSRADPHSGYRFARYPKQAEFQSWNRGICRNETACDELTLAYAAEAGETALYVAVWCDLNKLRR